MQMDDDIFHFGIIHCPLSRSAPRRLRAFEIGEHANDIDGFEIVKVERHGVGHTTAEDKVEVTHQGREAFTIYVFEPYPQRQHRHWMQLH